jgi:hypothetical protein
MIVYAVVHSNYFPSEVDSLWVTRELAEKRAEEVNKAEYTSSWHAVAWAVGEENEGTNGNH